MKPKKTWVVVADGARARLFANEHPGAGLQPLADGVLEGSRALDSEIGTDEPGRSFESVGGHRHATEPRTSPHEAAEVAFLKTVAERMEAGLAAHAFDRAVVVAAPKALGTLRAVVSPALAAVIPDTVPKDLTRAPLDQIEREIGAIIDL